MTAKEIATVVSYGIVLIVMALLAWWWPSYAPTAFAFVAAALFLQFVVWHPGGK